MNRFLTGLDLTRYSPVHIQDLESFADSLDSVMAELIEKPHVKGAVVTTGGDSRRNAIVEEFRKHYGLTYAPSMAGIALTLTPNNQNENWLRFAAQYR